MKKNFLFLLFILVFATLFSQAKNIIQDGIIHIDNAVLEKPIVLSGQWNFVKGSLLGPKDFEAAFLKKGQPIAVPYSWYFDDFEHGIYGAGTYHLRINCDFAYASLAIKIPRISDAYTAYWNGKEIARVGSPGETKKSHVSQWKMLILPLELVKKENDLIIAVSNFNDISSGILSAPSISTIQILERTTYRNFLGEYFVLGALLIMAVYHFCLFLFRREDKPSLFFAFLSLVLGFRQLFYGDMGIYEIFPHISHIVLFKLGYLSFSFAVIGFIGFLYSIFPSKIFKIETAIIFSFSFLYSLIIIFGPIEIIARVLIFFQVFVVFFGIVALIEMIKAIVHKRESSVLFFIGVLVFFFAVVIEIFASIVGISDMNIVPKVLLVFMFFQSLIIAKKFRNALVISKRYGENLENLNRSLERFIPREVLSFLNKDSIMDIQIGEHTELLMTILVIDIRNFTYFSERLSPEENFKFLNSYLKRIAPIIRNNNGFIDKYMGDGFMALFPDSPGCAIKTALEIRKAMLLYNEHRSSCNYEPIAVGIGIHSGKLMLGTVGDAMRMDSTVISDTVNVAFRIEGLTKTIGKDILVSRCVVAELEAEESCRFISCGKHKIKGKDEPIEVYEILSS
ncbi:MAG TPA: hypothetical protein DDW88_00715 [Treponema sp.]|nr:hypothetical protein [Treponema sp.]